eukprot:g888.t1
MKVCVFTNANFASRRLLQTLADRGHETVKVSSEESDESKDIKMAANADVCNDMEWQNKTCKRYIIACLGLDSKNKDEKSKSSALPMIHVRDFSEIVAARMTTERDDLERYVVAVDDSKSSLEEIVKAVSKNVASGSVCYMTKAETLRAYLPCRGKRDATAIHRAVVLPELQIDLHFKPKNPARGGKLLDAWHCKQGLVANIDRCAAEHLAQSKVRPMRIAIVGAPRCGKTAIAKQISEHLSLPYFDVNVVIADCARSFLQSNDDEEEEREEDIGNDLRKRLFEAISKRKKIGKEGTEAPTIKEEDLNLAGPFDSRVDMSLIRDLVRHWIRTNRAPRRYGWVMDGVIRSSEEARFFFDEDAGLRPDVVFVLDGHDDTLLERCSSKDESSKLKTLLKAYRSHSPYVPSIVDEGKAEEDISEQGEASKEVTGSRRAADHLGGVYFESLEGCKLQNVDVTLTTSVQDVLVNIRPTIVALHHASRPSNFVRSGESLAFLSPKADGIEDGSKNENGNTSSTSPLLPTKTEGREENAKEAERGEENAFANLRKEILLQSEPLHSYVETGLLPILVEGLRTLGHERPEDPIAYLAKWLVQRKCAE